MRKIRMVRIIVKVSEEELIWKSTRKKLESRYFSKDKNGRHKREKIHIHTILTE